MRTLFGKLNGEARFAVYSSGVMLGFISLVRIFTIHYIGHDDTILIQAQQAMVTLFTGSIVLDRASQGRKGYTNGTDEPDTTTKSKS